MIKILRLSNGKKVYIQGKEITTDEAHEIIIRLTETWGTDFEKQDLRDAALGLKRGGYHKDESAFLSRTKKGGRLCIECSLKHKKES